MLSMIREQKGSTLWDRSRKHRWPRAGAGRVTLWQRCCPVISYTDNAALFSTVVSLQYFPKSVQIFSSITLRIDRRESLSSFIFIIYIGFILLNQNEKF